MTIIDAINKKAQESDVIYNQGNEPNCDYTVDDRLTTVHDILKSIPAELLLKDNWVIKRKIKPETFECDFFVKEMNITFDTDVLGFVTKEDSSSLIKFIKPNSRFKLIAINKDDMEIIK